MNKSEFEAYIFDTFSVAADHPFGDHPEFAVYRHAGNRKWFALVMSVPRAKLGLDGAGSLDIVNVKCDPLLSGSLRENGGIFPAYHMNKEQWLSAALDNSVDDEVLKMLVQMSFDATAPKPKSKRAKNSEKS